MLWKITSPASVILACLLAGGWAFAASPQDSQTVSNDKPSKPKLSIYEERPINWKTLVPDIVRDQKPIWTFPASLAEGHHWGPTLAMGAIFGGLVALDPHDSPYFRNNASTYSSFNRAFSSTHTDFALAIVPASLYALGYIRKDSYATHTSLLAVEAVADSAFFGWVAENATGRLRPEAIPPGGSYADTWFKTYHPVLRADGSFPSEHSLAAFSIATIFARRYSSHRWVPWVAYGAATLVGFSRLSLQQHFPSDVFVGAAIGYVISRFVVMPGREPED
jgi:membrane-associated phospholipid phosphatase